MTALPGSPASTSSTACTEKVENVVKPPRNPNPEPLSHVSTEPVLRDKHAEEERPDDVDGDGRPDQRLVMERQPPNTETREDAEQSTHSDVQGRHRILSSTKMSFCLRASQRGAMLV